MTDSSYAVRFLFIAGSQLDSSRRIDMLWRGGACVLNGLPPGEFPISIFRKRSSLSRFSRVRGHGEVLRVSEIF